VDLIGERREAPTANAGNDRRCKAIFSFPHRNRVRTTRSTLLELAVVYTAFRGVGTRNMHSPLGTIFSTDPRPCREPGIARLSELTTCRTRVARRQVFNPLRRRTPPARPCNPSPFCHQLPPLSAQKFSSLPHSPPSPTPFHLLPPSFLPLGYQFHTHPCSLSSPASPLPTAHTSSPAPPPPPPPSWSFHEGGSYPVSISGLVSRDSKTGSK